MAKFTHKQSGRIYAVLQRCEATQKYLSKPDVTVARVGGPATTTLHFTRADGRVLYEVNKEYGSDLAQLQIAIADLKALLTEHGGYSFLV